VTALMDDLEVDRWDSDISCKPSYNISPAQETPILTLKNKRVIQGMHWGFVPNWSKECKLEPRMINARVEKLTEKPAYASLLQSKRCIIIANGYYEWMRTSQGKRPYYIHDSGNSMLPFAGLWATWKNDKKQYRITCTIITTEPISELKHIHNRMPVIITKERMDEWIYCSHPQAVVLQL